MIDIEEDVSVKAECCVSCPSCVPMVFCFCFAFALYYKNTE